MSSKTFKIVKSLRERLIGFSTKSDEIPNEFKSGIIFGFTLIEENNLSYCLGTVANESDIPSGMTSLGIYSIESLISDNQLTDLCLKYFKNKKSGKLLILTTINENNSFDLKTKFLDIKSKQFCESGLQVVDDNEAIDKTIIVRLKTNISLRFQSSKDKQIFSDNLIEALNKFKEGINSFDVQLIQSSFKTNISVNDKSFNSITLTDLYGYLEEDPDLFDGIEVPANMKKKMIEKMRKKKATDKSPLEFMTTDDNCPKSDYKSEIELTDNQIDLDLLVDSLSLIQDNNSVSYLLKLFSTQIKQKSEALVKSLIESIDFQTNKILIPKIYNFWPKNNCNHFISVVFPMALNDEQLIDKRKEIHLKYLIPMERPLFRKSNRFLLDTEKTETGYLTSVHIGLKDSGLKGGQIIVVYGDYTYYHYMQDRIDDNGWGCAYRSLQTIISWFRHQSYIDKPVPNHTDIQRALVDVGDKQESFVGSRQWIGSQEVSYVLSHLYGITSKIMFVSSGAELANKGRELAHHFTTNGTPIMIGGGVLAHTIIGINFDENTGEIKFLILDPHYTGAEDLVTIQKKGWCGWKGPTFWDKNSFYNLCLPLRPQVF